MIIPFSSYIHVLSDIFNLGSLTNIFYDFSSYFPIPLSLTHQYLPRSPPSFFLYHYLLVHILTIFSLPMRILSLVQSFSTTWVLVLAGFFHAFSMMSKEHLPLSY